VEGSFHKDAALSKAGSPQERCDMYCALVDSLARIHAVDVDAVGLGAYGKRRAAADDAAQAGYVARQVKVSGLVSALSRC
jgi:hypothetical protein